LCTSGTAAANFHPAVLEAFHGRVPLVVCTADRPPELRDTGAGQTIDQGGLFGGAVRWSVDAGGPEGLPGVGAVWRSRPSPAATPGAGAVWRAPAPAAATAATGPPAGPVHLTPPFREPLVPSGAPLVDAPGRAGGAPWTGVLAGERAPSDEVVERLADVVASN